MIRCRALDSNKSNDYVRASVKLERRLDPMVSQTRSSWKAALGLIILWGFMLPSIATRAADFEKWEKEIAAYEQADRTSLPPKGGLLFIGSSTIRLWKT